MADKTYLITLDKLEKATHGFSSEKVVGQGGFGTVYRGKLNGTPVAVRRLAEGGDSEAFKQEAEILRTVLHPNVVLFMGYCPEGNCIMSEYLKGGSLDDWLSGSSPRFPPLPWVDRLRIFSEMATALLYLHKEKRILHRDLKPANVLLDQGKTAKLADMGLARLYDGENLRTKLAGTIGYAPVDAEGPCNDL